MLEQWKINSYTFAVYKKLVWQIALVTVRSEKATNSLFTGSF